MFYLVPRRLWTFLVLALLLPALPTVRGGDQKKPTPAAAAFFETKVRPILSESCFRCHGEKKQRGDLRLDSLAAALEGGGRGPALVPGNAAKSLMIKAIGHEDKDLKMPEDKKLPREQIDILTQWVNMGAPWPGAAKAVDGPRKGEFVISDKDRAHWSLQPVKRPAVPAVKNAAWVKNPIDAFILAQLEANGIIATGYYRLGIWDVEPSDPVLARYDGLDDIVATTGQVMLGLTFDCARCHNHKIDPISHKDYHRLLAFFHNINHFRNGGPTDEAVIFTTPEQTKAFEAQERELDKKRKEVQAELTKVEDDFRRLLSVPENEEVREFARVIQLDGPKLLGKQRYAAYMQLKKRLEGLK